MTALRARAAAWGAVLATLAGLGCAGPPFEAGCSSEAGSRTVAPLMWRAADAAHGGVVYLLGSIHFDVESPQPYPDRIESAFASADELVVEVDVIHAAESQGAQDLGERLRLEPPTQLADVLSAPTLERLAQFLAERDLPLAFVEGLKPWYIAQLLVLMELREAGYDAAHGVDRQFIERSGDKPIVELETTSAQFDMLDRLPPRIQEAMLADALNRSGEFDRASDRLIEAWRSGDEPALEQLVFVPVGNDPEFEAFYESVFFRRNAAMTARLVELARDGKTRFAVLGAGHMLGPRGIPSLLCERGFEVRRVSGGARATDSD